jgi:TetR/AcrR family fatty acid metabolism transcriptional regulator
LIEEDQNLAEVFQVELRQSSKFLKDYHNQKFIDYLNIIGQIIKEGQISGEFRQDIHINTIKLAIFGALDELARQWILRYEPRFQLSETATFLAEIFIKGLSPN